MATVPKLSYLNWFNSKELLLIIMENGVPFSIFRIIDVEGQKLEVRGKKLGVRSRDTRLLSGLEL